MSPDKNEYNKKPKAFMSCETIFIQRADEILYPNINQNSYFVVDCMEQNEEKEDNDMKIKVSIEKAWLCMFNLCMFTVTPAY